MDPIIKSYEFVKFSEMHVCLREGILYQEDMSKSIEYADEYFDRYKSYEGSETSKKLNLARTNITEKYCTKILDVGIGSGEFIKSSKIKVLGYDINLLAVNWLIENGIYANPFESTPDIDGWTFWDSLEHMTDPHSILSLVKKGQYVFISMPIFNDILDVKKSKHYKPNEHYYYFTAKGMKKYMADLYFELIEISDCETLAGRESILTFVFKRYYQINE